MIRELRDVLPLDRPLIGVDLETTGVDPRTSAVVELALEIMTPTLDIDGVRRVAVKEYRTLVNPLMPIPEVASKIHGITNESVIGAPTFVQLADNLLKGFADVDFCGYNVRFDLRQLDEEFKRAGKTWSYDNARIIDAQRLWQIAEGRTLSHAIKRWVREENTSDAHSALWDAKMSTRVIAAQLAETASLPCNVQRLHDLCWPDWFDGDGKLRWNRDGALCIGFGQHKDTPLHLAPRGYLQWMTGRDFSDRVKRACVDCLNGRVLHKPSKETDEAPL